MYEERLLFAKKLVKLAEEPILKHYEIHNIENKADGSEVTQADTAAEQRIRAAIESTYKDDMVLGEEYGGKPESREGFQWIIDPLDGTTWYTLGVPIFGTLIALLKDGIPVIGVIHFPMTQETIFAGENLGCWYSNQKKTAKVQVDPVSDLDKAIVSASGIHKSDLHIKNEQASIKLSNVIQYAKKFRFCGDCLQHALVCRGKIHAGIDSIMQAWDSAAIIPCIKEAGGIVTDLNGKTEDLVWAGNLISSSHEKLHSHLLELLKA